MVNATVKIIQEQEEKRCFELYIHILLETIALGWITLQLLNIPKKSQNLVKVIQFWRVILEYMQKEIKYIVEIA